MTSRSSRRSVPSQPQQEPSSSSSSTPPPRAVRLHPPQNRHYRHHHHDDCDSSTSEDESYNNNNHNDTDYYHYPADDDDNNDHDHGSPSKGINNTTRIRHDKSKSNSKTKKKFVSRSLTEELRLCVLTGQLRRLMIMGLWMVVVGMVSFMACQSVLGVLWALPQSSNSNMVGQWRWWSSSTSARISYTSTTTRIMQQAGYHAKPAMMGYYFHDVSSLSFIGKVERIEPPQHHAEWMALLHNRLLHHHQHQHADPKQQQSHHHHHHHVHDENYDENNNNDDQERDATTTKKLPSVDPLSDLDIQHDIETGSEYYDENRPVYTPNPHVCAPQYQWQTKTISVCNLLHEVSMMPDRMFLEPQRAVLENDGSNDDDDYYAAHPSQSHEHHHHHHHEHNRLRRRLGEEHQHHHHHHHVTTTARDAADADATQTDAPETDAPAVPSKKQHYKLLAHGYWRDTWMLQQPDAPPSTRQQKHHHHHSAYNPKATTKYAFKTLRMEHDLTEYVVDKQRRDAVTSDRISASPYSIHMHGVCGTSALYEFAQGGDLEALIDGSFDTAKDYVQYYPSSERFQLAYNITSALADLHTTEGPGRPTGIVHGDIKVDQFVAVTPPFHHHHNDDDPATHKMPHFKLGDFNLARFVYWNTRNNHPCVIEPDGDGGAFRAPEEYADQHGRTEKVDIYSLGNVLYTVLTGHWPFDDLENAHGTRELKQLVQQGTRPHLNIDADFRHSEDPLVQALVVAIDMCWKQDPHERASAREVEEHLGQYL